MLYREVVRNCRTGRRQDGIGALYGKTQFRQPRTFCVRANVTTKLPASTDHGLVDYTTIRYDAICYFNVRSKADMSQLNLPHGNYNEKEGENIKKLKKSKKNGYAQKYR